MAEQRVGLAPRALWPAGLLSHGDKRKLELAMLLAGRPDVILLDARRDLVGARHRVLAAHVYRISESTAALRAACRAFHRARRLEAKADRRPWEDDD